MMDAAEQRRRTGLSFEADGPLVIVDHARPFQALTLAEIVEADGHLHAAARRAASFAEGGAAAVDRSAAAIGRSRRPAGRPRLESVAPGFEPVPNHGTPFDQLVKGGAA